MEQEWKKGAKWKALLAGRQRIRRKEMVVWAKRAMKEMSCPEGG